MKIVDLICSSGFTGFYFDDQKAIKSGAKTNGSTYDGKPVTDGFKSIRQKGESISVMLILEDGQVALGDCVAVQYSGAGGRDPLFLAKDFIPIIEKEIRPLLVNKDITTFKEMAKKIDDMPLHTAIRYGVTQSILDAVAKKNKKTMAQVICDEYGTTLSTSIIPTFSQSGDDRYNNADKMIIKSANVMPHALINNVDTKLGKNGELLEEYVVWLKNRVIQLREDDTYNPIFHIDVYGTMGMAFNNDIGKIVDLLGRLEKCASPFALRIEGPIDAGNRTDTMIALRDIRKLSEEKNINVEIVADEWCNTYDDVVYFTDNKAGHMAQIKTPDLGGINNTIEAVLYCQQNNMGAYIGGSCNESERSAQVCAHIAMATSPIQTLAKPGMGVDEGLMLMRNEMNRILALKNL